jgi:hypothetical protein
MFFLTMNPRQELALALLDRWYVAGGGGGSLGLSKAVRRGWRAPLIPIRVERRFRRTHGLALLLCMARLQDGAAMGSGSWRCSTTLVRQFNRTAGGGHPGLICALDPRITGAALPPAAGTMAARFSVIALGISGRGGQGCLLNLLDWPMACR